MEAVLSTEKKWISWNENIQHNYEQLIKVTEESELIEAVKKADKIRVFGKKQSSSDIQAGTATIVDITSYNKVISIDKVTKEVTVQSGIALGDLIEVIQAQGWCIPCLPDINTITIGGALATGTHGTNGYILAKYVSKFRVILADGTAKDFTEAHPEMDAFRLSLGVLGFFSEITFKCEENYRLHLKEAPQTDEEWTSNLDVMYKNNDFLRILWLPHTNHGYVIQGNKVDEDFTFVPKEAPSYIKHRRKTSKILYKYTHIFPRFTSTANKILYKLFFTPEKEHAGSLYDATVTKSRGATMELAEWTIPYTKFQDLFKDLKAVLEDRSNKAYVHVPMDVRFIKKDNVWLSYASEEDTVTIGCVCRVSPKANEYEAFKRVEEVFLKHGGRPHWGKRFAIQFEGLSKLYPKWNDFINLREVLDPKGKFLNAYLTKLFQQ